MTTPTLKLLYDIDANARDFVTQSQTSLNAAKMCLEEAIEPLNAILNTLSLRSQFNEDEIIDIFVARQNIEREIENLNLINL